MYNPKQEAWLRYLAHTKNGSRSKQSDHQGSLLFRQSLIEYAKNLFLEIDTMFKGFNLHNSENEAVSLIQGQQSSNSLGTQSLMLLYKARIARICYNNQYLNFSFEDRNHEESSVNETYRLTMVHRLPTWLLGQQKKKQSRIRSLTTFGGTSKTSAIEPTANGNQLSFDQGPNSSGVDNSHLIRKLVTLLIH